jgi:hypothetical protein
MNEIQSYRDIAIVKKDKSEEDLSFFLKLLKFFVPYKTWYIVDTEIKRFKSRHGSFDIDHLILSLEKKPLLFSSLLPIKKRIIISDEHSQRYNVEFFDLKDGKKLLKVDSEHFWDLWRNWERKQDFLKVIKHGTEVKP